MTNAGAVVEMSEGETIAMLLDFGARLRARTFDGLWVPTCMVQDGELDDCLAWLLLDKIHSTKSAPSLLLEALGFTDQFHVLFQLPVDSRMDSLAARFSKYASILRDPGSRNVEAVASNFGLGREKAQ